jgi:replicative superfamily II helicase
MGISDLSVSAFRQMCGRAGRMGLDSEGEAILLVTPREWALGTRLLTAELSPLTSSLHEGVGGGIEKLLLEMIYCDKLIQPAQISMFMMCTLLYVQQPPDEVRHLIIFYWMHHTYFILFSVVP